MDTSATRLAPAVASVGASGGGLAGVGPRTVGLEGEPEGGSKVKWQ